MLLQAVSMPDSALQTARSTADSDEAFSDLASSDDDFNEPYNARKNLYAPPVLLVSVECDSRAFRHSGGSGGSHGMGAVGYLRSTLRLPAVGAAAGRLAKQMLQPLGEHCRLELSACCGLFRTPPY